jgi:uncharacterized protein (DUF1697 family)
MALVVFLRGVNVGGHRTFQPSALARELADLDVTSVGAAGTFVVRKRIGQAALRARILRKLPVEAQIMICPSRALLALASRAPLPDELPGSDIKLYLSILATRYRLRKGTVAGLPSLPITQPAGADWQVKIIEVTGRFALSLHRRMGRTLVYPNEVVEKMLGVPATTRNWNTTAAICAVLKST